MPFNDDSATTLSCQEFCLAMKTARERKGVTLAEITATTKIPSYLMEGLERNDLRRWPTGLFRRSFFRDYARMIGVSVTDAVAEFVRLFPDEQQEEPATTAGSADAGNQAEGSGLAMFTATLKRGADAISRVFERPDNGPTEPAAEPARSWVSDARRVASSPPRFRVRIKVPR